MDVPIDMVRRATTRAGLEGRGRDHAGRVAGAAWASTRSWPRAVRSGRRARRPPRDLVALAGRSQRPEAAALTDPGALGGHTVLRLVKR